MNRSQCTFHTLFKLFSDFFVSGWAVFLREFSINQKSKLFKGMHFYVSLRLILQTALMVCDSFWQAARATCHVSLNGANACCWAAALSRHGHHDAVMQWTQRDAAHCWSLIYGTWVPSFRTGVWLRDDPWTNLNGAWMMRIEYDHAS